VVFVALKEESLESELFHLLHKAVMLINEGREYDDKLLVFDRELGEAVKIIMQEDISRNLNKLIIDDWDSDAERYSDCCGGERNDND
jgi:hypothetical protein